MTAHLIVLAGGRQRRDRLFSREDSQTPYDRKQYWWAIDNVVISTPLSYIVVCVQTLICIRSYLLDLQMDLSRWLTTLVKSQPTCGLCLQGSAGYKEGRRPGPAWSTVLQHRPLWGGPAGVQGGCCPAARQHWHLAGSGEHTHTHTLNYVMPGHRSISVIEWQKLPHVSGIETWWIINLVWRVCVSLLGSGFSHGWS